MESDGRILVPVGPDAGRWRTFEGERTLVVAARTVTSLVRVLDVVPDLFRDDPRVTVVFAYDPTSAFSDGVLDLLRARGCRTMPWSQLPEVSPDLLISASENIKVPPGDYPVLVLPHGVGFHKLVPDSEGAGTRLSGLVPDELLAARRAWLAVSHPDQAAQLGAAHPGTVGRTVLVGDPCLDRLRVSAGPRRRDGYRAALGVRAGQRLVLVSSTWGGESLAGRWPALPGDLLAQLPVDEFRVALVLHPNVWSAHGTFQVRVIQRSALDAGLVLVDPTDGWQQALVAADLVIGDHGSVTLYGAALGRPVLLGAFGSEAVPGTAGHALRSAADPLHPDRPLAAQLHTALTGHRTDRFAAVTEAAFAEPGAATSRLRDLAYQLLDLPPHKSTAATGAPRGPLALPPPPPATHRATALQVRVVVERDATGTLVVRVRRLPALLAPEIVETAETAETAGPVPDGGPATYGHLACHLDEPDTRMAESASVIWSDGGTAADTLERLLADHPGALIAALPGDGDGDGECVVAVRGRRTTSVFRVGGGPEPLEPGLGAALVYALLRHGVPVPGATAVLQVGERRRELTVRPTAQSLAGPAESVSRASTTDARGLPPAS
ncbi:hypothetical protein [Streptomyces sp. NPDC090025]|uniref:hypothetical protein n=1 Tax=Streptomyces sp. NPDC090025 TaxID=3365922 RepID=UPI0038346DFF